MRSSQPKLMVAYLVFLITLLSTITSFAENNADKNTSDKADNKQTSDQQTPEKSPWAGSNVQFGFTMNTGNTESKNLNGGLLLDYTRGKWQSTTNLNGQFNTGSSGTNKEVFSATEQGEYSFTPRNFVYLKIDSTFDRFNPYDYVVTESLGLGRKIINTKKVVVTVQAGPGGRHTRETATKIVRNDVILDTNANLVWYITDKSTFKEALNADFGPPYNYYQADSTLTTQLIGDLGVQIAFTIQYYSRIPPLSTRTFKTDTTTTIGLVYSF